MNVRRLSAVVATVALSVAMAAPIAVSATDPAPDNVPDGMDWSPSAGRTDDPLAPDAAFIAAREGRPFPEVLAQLRGQQRIDALMAPIATRADFAGSYWDDGVLVVMLTGVPPDSVLEELQEESRVTVRVTIAEHSVGELEQMSHAVRAALHSVGVADADIVTAIDPKGQRVAATAGATSAGLEGAARAAVAGAAPADAVSLSFTDGPVFVDLAAH